MPAGAPLGAGAGSRPWVAVPSQLDVVARRAEPEKVRAVVMLVAPGAAHATSRDATYAARLDYPGPSRGKLSDRQPVSACAAARRSSTRSA
ncbi:MAG: hypothetical protein GEV04_24165 [Actinophytocola sp.]|nr:hypothetical protein [Actinophytocola sp.]